MESFQPVDKCDQFGSARCNKGLFGFETVEEQHCSCNFCLDRLSLKCNSSFRNEIQTPLNADLGDMQRLYEPGAQLFWSPPTTGHSHTTWGGWNPQTPGVPNELVVQNLKVILSYLDWPLRMVWVETVNLKIIMKVIEPTLKALSNLIKHIGEEFVASLQNAEGVQWLPVRRTVRSMQEVKRGALDKAILT